MRKDIKKALNHAENAQKILARVLFNEKIPESVRNRAGEVSVLLEKGIEELHKMRSYT